MPWWLVPLAALAGGLLALPVYVLALGALLGAIAYVAAKVYRWLEEHL